MENKKVAMTVLEDVIAVGANERLHELSELQLTLVGGGVGEITPY